MSDPYERHLLMEAGGSYDPCEPDEEDAEDLADAAADAAYERSRDHD